LLTILIPAYDEEERIAPTLSVLAGWAKERRGTRIIVVSDGDDSTATTCRRFAGAFKPRLEVISFPHRLGKGAAILVGLRKSTGDVLSFDADASLELSEVPKMRQKLKAADIVIASRRRAGSKAIGAIPFYRRCLSFLLNSFVRLLFGFSYSDTQCGYKLYSRKAARKLSRFAFSSSGYEWDVEMLVAARKMGLVVAERPVAWAYRKGSKARPLDLLKMTLGILQLRLRYLWLGWFMRGVRGPSSRTSCTRGRPQS